MTINPIDPLQRFLNSFFIVKLPCPCDALYSGLGSAIAVETTLSLFNNLPAKYFGYGKTGFFKSP